MTRSIRSFEVVTPTARLHGVRFGAGPPLLCVHALAFSSRYFAAAAATLGAAFECIAIDQRGHGETVALDDDRSMTPRGMAADLAAVLDAAGWESACVGGISLGAATALRLALEHPRRVRALIQDLPAFGPLSPRGIGKSARVAEALCRGALGEAAQAAGDGLSPPRARALEQVLLAAWEPYPPSELGPKLAQIFRASATWQIVASWPSELASLKMPVEILALPGDRSHPIEVARQMAAVIPRARLTMRVPSLDPNKALAQWIELLAGWLPASR